MSALMRWGILGTGNIAGKFAKDLRTIPEGAVLQAVGSRDLAKATAFAQAHGGPTAYGSYEEVLADKAVDAVYISLLNHHHAAWSIKAAQAGKHILCEKPATMTHAELVAVIAAVTKAGVFFMEAYAYRCHPRYARLRELLAENTIGEVRMLHATFAFDGSTLGRPRLFAVEQGGGGLMDVGVYPLSWLRWFGDGEPVAAKALGIKGASGVDEWVSGVLRFANHRIASFATAIRCVQPSVATIYGSLGSIDIEEPWRCPASAALVVNVAGKTPLRILNDDGLGLYAREALMVSRHAADKQAPVCTWDDSLSGMRLLDELRHQVGVWWPGESKAPGV